MMQSPPSRTDILVREGGLRITSGDFNRCVLTAFAVAMSLVMGIFGIFIAISKYFH